MGLNLKRLHGLSPAGESGPSKCKRQVQIQNLAFKPVLVSLDRAPASCQRQGRFHQVHTTHYTLHTAYYTLHTTHYTLHTAHYPLPTTHYTLGVVLTFCGIEGFRPRMLDHPIYMWGCKSLYQSRPRPDRISVG